MTEHLMKTCTPIKVGKNRYDNYLCQICNDGEFFFEPSCNVHFSQQCRKPRRRPYDRCNRCHVLGHIANVSWKVLDLLECVFIQIFSISSSGVYKLTGRSNSKDMVNVSKNSIIARTVSLKKLHSRTYPSF